MTSGKERIISHQALAELLVKQQGIHEGIWGLFIRFGINAVNIPSRLAEDSPITLMPAAIIPVLEIGIQPFAEVNDLSVDAAVVNPKPKTTMRGRKKATKTKRK